MSDQASWWAYTDELSYFEPLIYGVSGTFTTPTDPTDEDDT